MTDDKPERLGFDAVPKTYDRIRPTYPAALHDELFGLLPREPRIVEVGPGTGQATADLLKRGATVTAVEVGSQLASFLERKLGADKHLKVICSCRTPRISPTSMRVIAANSPTPGAK